MVRWQIGASVCLALVAFAANSVLCRLALNGGGIGPGTFTAVRVCTGALMLLLIANRETLRFEPRHLPSAIMLFVYAASFSFAYVSLTAGTGALLLFGAVQITMLAGGLIKGERPELRTWIGWALALAGLIYLITPGFDAPPVREAFLMMAAGAAWGVYSLLGRRESDAIGSTARNFVLAAPLALILFWGTMKFEGRAETSALIYAVVSGAVTSGLGYVIWYVALRHITSVSAAIAQLSVPVLAALAGIIFLSESMTLRLALAALAIIGGIAMGLRISSPVNSKPTQI